MELCEDRDSGVTEGENVKNTNDVFKESEKVFKIP